MRKTIPFSEVLRRVMEESGDEFSSSDEEVVGDIAIDGEQHVFNQTGLRFSSKSNVDPCLLDSALLNDDEVGEVSHANFFVLVFFCIHFLVVGM